MGPIGVGEGSGTLNSDDDCTTMLVCGVGPGIDNDSDAPEKTTPKTLDEQTSGAPIDRTPGVRVRFRLSQVRN